MLNVIKKNYLSLQFSAFLRILNRIRILFRSGLGLRKKRHSGSGQKDPDPKLCLAMNRHPSKIVHLLPKQSGGIRRYSLRYEQYGQPEGSAEDSGERRGLRTVRQSLPVSLSLYLILTLFSSYFPLLYYELRNVHSVFPVLTR